MNQGFQRFLKSWFASRAGKVVFKQEKALIDSALQNLFGYFLVQLGCVSDSSLLDNSRISCKLVIDSIASRSLAEKQKVQWVQSDFDFLPVGKDKVDVVLLPHTLETVDDPYYVLRQVDSMLVAEGHMVITGFNPIGCVPLRFKFFAQRKEFAASQQRRAGKIKEWLEVLGYEVEQTRYSPVMCFSANEKYKRWTSFIEKIERSLQGLGIEFGNVYCIVAKKRVDAPTLVGLKWHLPRWQKSKNGSIASQRLKTLQKKKIEERACK